MARKKHRVKSGDVFGQWTALEPVNVGKYRYYWLCRCSCGREIPVQQARLLSGGTKKCRECFLVSVPKGEASPSFVHGSKTVHRKLYRVWCGMRNRCHNPSEPAYPRYGGRGIKVCKRWDDFMAFYADMGERPTPKHQLDRINNDGDYSPENCRWATPTQNARNTSRNRFVTVNGETHCIAEWAEVSGISLQTIKTRIQTLNWSPERAVTTPPRRPTDPRPSQNKGRG